MKSIELKSLVDKHDKIAILSGAGVSVESGIPSFRGEGGIYHSEYAGHSPQAILSEHFFKKNKAIFWRFVNEILLAGDPSPSSAHLFAKSLMEDGKLTGVLTQNIDGLYQKAGVSPVVEMHGNAHFGFCEKCKKEFALSSLQLNKNDIYLSTCCSRVVKPSIVLYDGTFDNGKVKKYFEIMNEASLLLVMGTSLDVAWHKDNVIEFNGEIALINEDKVELSGWAGERAFDYEFIGKFNELL